MMIAYTSLPDETLHLIKEHFLIPNEVLIKFDEENTSEVLEKIPSTDLILLGEKTKNPIKLSQQIYKHDRYISILLICEAESYQKIKQSLLFTPFLGPTINCVSNSAGTGLANVIKDHIQRTQQRRSYQNIKNTTNLNAPFSSQSIERVKADYINLALEEAPIGISLIRKNNIILSFNNFASNLFNKTEKEVLGKSIISIFPHNLQGQVYKYLENQGTEKGSFTVHLAAENRYLEITLSKLKENDAFKVVLIADVTDQIQAIKLKEDGAQRVKFILESMPEMAWTALPDGRIDFLNAVWTKKTGQPIEEGLGTGWLNVLHPEDKYRVDELWKTTLRYGTSYEVECRYWKAKENNYRWHLTRANPIKNENGEIIMWVGTCADIQELHIIQSELQSLTEELAASNEELRAANEEISANNEDLYIMNDKLIKVNADLDNFIYTASHDLKAPITNIEGLVIYLTQELQQKGWEDKGVKRIINMIETSIERFKRTITDLTEISKIQRLTDLEFEIINVFEIINEVILDLQPFIRQTDAVLDINIDQELRIPFSRKNFKSIIYNLLSNSLKYRSPDRRPIIKMGIAENNNYYNLFVQDNGLGFDLKDEDKIFSMFKRLHSHVEGTGIGLYMVKKILDNSGGKIHVNSHVGVGSTFEIQIKKKNSENDAT